MNTYEEEAHGWPEIAGTVVSAFILFGIAGLFVGAIWGWALERQIWPGALAGFVGIGLLASFSSLPVAFQQTRERRRALSFGMWAMVFPLVILLGILGIVVGLFTRVFL